MAKTTPKLEPQLQEIRPTKPRTWLSRRSPLERTLLFLLVLCGLLICCFLFLYISHFRAHKPEVCTTAGCVSAAADLLSAMDPTALLEDAGAKTFESKSIEMSRIAYKACMDEGGINRENSSKLWSALQELHHWPLLHTAPWKDSDFQLSELMGTLKRHYAADVFVTVFVYADGKNTTNNILYVDQGSLALQAREYYLNETQFASQLEAYQNLFFRTTRLLANDSHKNLDSKTLKREIEEVMELETKLANFSSPEATRRNATRLYNKWTLRDLQTNVPEIEWDTYFKIILPPDIWEMMRSNSMQVIVQEPEYLEKLGHLMQTADKRVVVNYMLWRVVKLWSKVLDSRYEDLIQEFLRVMVGRMQKPPRWKSCVMATVGWFDMATGSLYVQEHFNSLDKTEALEMIENLQVSFKEIVLELDWMDEETRAIAMQKADSMIKHIGYPELVTSPEKLDKYYEGLVLTTNDSYFQIAKKIAVWTQNKELQELKKKFDREKFDISPAVVNAFYSPEKNAITFPAGILQPPFFRGDYPKSVNYGAMGAVIGHEITHGFDDQGSQYDLDGNLQNWWSDHSMWGFLNRTQCMVRQYGNYVVPEVKMRVNGHLTQGENIADNGGIKEAYRAYRAYVSTLSKPEPRLPGLDLNNDQIFFLSFANFWCGHKKDAAAVQQVLTDPHSPEMFRVIGVMTNSHEFAAAYNCKPGTNMNPLPYVQPKCEVW